jgi:hypothetical protein
MAQTVRGGRAMLNRLDDIEREALRLIEEMDDQLLPPNIRLLQRDLGALRDLMRDLRQQRSDLEAILLRREKAGVGDIDDLLARITELEAWRAQQERSAAPDPARRVEPRNDRR